MSVFVRSGFGFGFELQRKRCRKQTPRFGGQRWEGSFVSNQEKQVQKIPGSNTWVPCKDEYYQWKRSVEASIDWSLTQSMSITIASDSLLHQMMGFLAKSYAF
ncbi:hypothetical protein QQ045_030972 [Rhodiola kirilowii]